MKFLRRATFTLVLFGLMAVAGYASINAFQQQTPPPQPPPSLIPPASVTPMSVNFQPTRPPFASNPDEMSVDYHRVTIDVENQIAATNVEMQFTNNGNAMVEGTFLFPLPPEAAVDNLTMTINGIEIEAKILRAEEARAVYNEIVRQYRDPALLEYVGTNAIQANVFPIPPGESRKIAFSYSQVLEADNGLIKVTYPMENTATNNRMVNEMRVTVNVESNEPLRNVYSPTHNVALTEDNSTFSAGFEATTYIPDGDFVLYYGIENDDISVNLLSYRESAGDDGFFMMLVQPPIASAEQVVNKDVILVVDQSGSMDGEKWSQAQDAADFVLNRLNPGDRFNMVVFSTGWRVFGNGLEPASAAGEASQWINSMGSGGGTDINGALLQALDLADAERPTTILFLTDGLASEGITDADAILRNLQDNAGNNVRIFTFGVGYDVNTFLLDRISSTFRGASSYVQPGENIEAEVSNLYSKIASPVLTDVELDFDGVRTDLIYPFGQLPDLFAGEQLTIVGRYRSGVPEATITLSGLVNNEPAVFTYDDMSFRERAGGEVFIARLWATRRIGDLLTQIRLNGETPELVDAVVDLSLEFGIITPYTSFLIEEDDILSQSGRDRAAEQFQPTAQAMSQNASGGQAVADADNALRQASVDNLLSLTATPLSLFGAPQMAMTQTAPPQAIGTPIAMNQAPPRSQNEMGVGAALDEADMEMEEALDDGFAAGEAQTEIAMAASSTPAPTATPPATPQPDVLNVGNKTFIWQSDKYVDTAFDPDTMEPEQVVFFSDDYFDLIDSVPELATYLSIGDALIVVIDGTAYEIVPEDL
ncbi:MAG: VIT domain-containing protein [Chloroflexota bacterium]